MSHIVTSEEEGTRFSDYALGRFLALPSRNAVKKAIKRGELRLDGRLASTGTRVRTGQSVSWHPSEARVPKPYELVLHIPYQDDHLAIVYKPAGLIVRGNQFKTLENAAVYNLSSSHVTDALLWPQPVHRLDRATQGLVLVARSERAKVRLAQMLAQREIEKQYLALVVGRPPEQGHWDLSVEGKDAHTDFLRLRSTPALRSDWVSLMALWPRTGRTHQLRIHAATAGHHIVGDQLHGPSGEVLPRKGLFLAAVGLRFPHPIYPDKAVDVQVNAPPKFDRRMVREAQMHKRAQAGDQI